ncbi:MAG: signal peptidase I [Bacilli bacterium]|jgi:signal peptidase
MKKNKGLKIILKILKGLIMLALILFIIAVCLQRFSNNRLSFFNYRMFTVVSGSMEPKYMIGDVLISKKVNPKTIKIGDTVSYRESEGNLKDQVITHEVVTTSKDESGKYVFQTRGIANLISDQKLVSENQLYGKVIYKAVLLSFVYRLLNTPMGFFIFIVIPLLFIITSEIIKVLLDKEEQRRKTVTK